ncbi:MAG: 3-methyl-2-oxobutanoate hydroxymethyltransferase [Gammaproteobacteria bacterium]|nr:3-methyl-2-oxobutanoate hydroxymethyltransferase [Gammaproteobacteria bacterium]
MSQRVTTNTVAKMKAAGDKITCLTAYDAGFAQVLDQAGIDAILIGDSLGMVVQGHESTLPVTLDDMCYHSRCVARGSQRALLIADLPFMSYQESPEQALRSAGALMKQGRAHMVKLEGGELMAPTVEFLVARGIPVCGHIGLTPQSVHQFGGYRVQGRDADGAEQLKVGALALQQAGAAMIVLEAIPRALARSVTESLTIPTIGIGAGPECDGQVLVLQDMLGIYGTPPKFTRDFTQGTSGIQAAVDAYLQAVKSGEFPASEHCYD